MTALAEIRVLDAQSWNHELASCGLRYRFSQRAEAVAACAQAYPEYTGRLLQAVYTDGARTLFPGVVARRRLPVLNAFLAMPLGWEGTPIPLAGEVTADRVRRFFECVGGIGALHISGGLAGSPPPVGEVDQRTTHVLDLSPGFDALWAGRFTGKNRNTCRKAENSGVTVVRMDGDAAADRYYALYADATRDWGLPSPPYPHALFRALAATAHAEFWLGVLDDAVVAGAVLLVGSEDVFYWSGAMARTAAGLSPSNLVLREAIRSACERGFRAMDFGGSDGLPGVRRFKESFGAEARPYRAVRLRTLGNRLVETVAHATWRTR